MIFSIKFSNFVTILPIGPKPLVMVRMFSKSDLLIVRVNTITGTKISRKTITPINSRIQLEKLS